METQTLTVDRAEAVELLRKYREHTHYSTPVDLEIQRALDAVVKGRKLIRAIASIVAAGLNEAGLPKLAIVRADAEQCHLYLRHDGGARFSMNAWAKDRNVHTYVDLPAGSFPDSNRRYTHHAAMTPLVPIHLRPKRGLANYHILFEAEWTRVVPKDPMLLRRIGRGDLWTVLATWDLTEIERAVLAGRLN